MQTESKRPYMGVVIILLLWLLFAQALGAARAASITFDEGPHLAVGYTTLRTGDLRLQPVHIHPPLANLLAAAPLLMNPNLSDPRDISGWEIASLSAVTDGVIWQYPHPARLALAGRLPIILLTLLAGALVFRWAADLGGAGAGLLALALYVFDPNIVAHGSLVTTDMAVTTFGLFSFFLLYRWRRRPTSVRLLGVGVMVGLALASKVSAVLILLLVEVILVLRKGRWDWRRTMWAGLVVGLVTLGTLWAVYGFEIRALPDVTGSLPLPAVTHLDVYRSLQEHYRLGHPAFLMGQNSDQGWWYYFPVAFVIKTPLPTLILLGAALLLSVWRRRRVDVTLVLYPVVYPATALFSSVDIGYRHLLPILPFVFIFVGSELCDVEYASGVFARRVVRRFDPRSIFIAGMVLWLVLGTALIYPYALTFFNELVGGPGGGYRWLVDSNLDWGQNLWGLRDWMQAEGVERVYYSHFSPGQPETYSVTADWLPPDPRAVPFAPFDPAPGVYAIGATTLQGVYTPDVNTYAYFRARSPDTVLDQALFLFRVPQHPAPDWAAVCSGFPLSGQDIQARIGQPGLRLIYYDCAASQVYPEGDDGQYLLLSGSDWPDEASLMLEGRDAGGRPIYVVLRSAERPSLEAAAGAVSVDGPLSFLAYELDGTEARPGEAVTLRTHWRVESVPDRPLSLMAHLLGPDGVPLAVGDGLGVPLESWQPGDVIVQKHRLMVPDEALPGEYGLQIGAYWLDTMERWSIHLDNVTVSDHLFVGKIVVLD
jgi:hypothetical protein